MATNHHNNWTCPKCGTVNNKNFCHTCGQPQPIKEDLLVCSCGYRNPSEAKFCGNCGRKLTANPPVPKKINIVAILFVVGALLVGGMVKNIFFSHSHQWEPATCTAPITCSECGETYGEPEGHQWIDSTCTVARYCGLCKATSGTPLGHKWKEATVDAPKTCTVCGATTGEKLRTGYLGTPSGRSQKTTLHDGSFTLNIHAFVLDETVRDCKELTVDMSVEMKAGTKCRDWQLWGRNNGYFQKIGKIHLPDGDGDICQTLTFDTPVTFDAVAITPTIPGGYSWSLWFEITDVWVEP